MKPKAKPKLPTNTFELQPGSCETDKFLRNHGFSISERPSDGTPLWSRDGRQYLESLALKLAKREWERDLMSLEAE